MKKTFYALFLCLCLVLSLAGCSRGTEKENLIAEKNAFRIIRQVDSSGKIGLSYVFPVNTEIMQAKGFNENEIRTYRFYLSLYIGALAQQYRQRQTVGSSVGNVTYFTDVDGLGFSVIFDDVDAQNRFFNVTSEQEYEKEESRTKTTGFFFRKMQMKTNFPVSSKAAAENLKQINSMAISAWCNVADQNQADILSMLDKSIFIYDYAHTQKTLKSELYYDDNNFRHNVFIRSLQEIESDSTITFYVSYPNTPIWYLTAIIVTFAVMGILYIAMKNRKEKSKFQIKNHA